MAEEASPELALKAAEELLERQRIRMRELVEDRDRLLSLLEASRALVKRGPRSAAWGPFFDAVAALEGRDG